MSNIISILKLNAEKYPHKDAIIDPAKKISYSELWKAVEKQAAYLHHKGIKPGDRILLFVPMSIELYINMLAIFYVGATAVFLDQWSNSKRLDLACKIAGCKAVLGIFKARLLWFVSSSFRHIPIYLNPYPTKNYSVIPFHKTQKTDTALITFTTGSTGAPKAAKRTHGFLLEQFDALIKVLAPKGKDIDLISLPIFVLMNLGVGSTSVIADFNPRKPEQLIPEKIDRQITAYKCTRIICSPHFLIALSRYMVDHSISYASITNVFTGGAAVYPNDAQLFIDAFKNIDGRVLYGSTEAEPISEISFGSLASQSIDKLKKGIDVGTLYQNIRLKIIKIIDGPVTDLAGELNDGTIGEIVVSGHHVLTEYYNSDEAFVQNKISVGDTIWHRTGDAGYINTGHLFLCGRCSALIKRSNQFIIPFVEEYKLKTIEGISSGTLLEKNAKIYCIVESQLHNAETIKSELLTLSIEYDELIVLKEIPKDPRHFSKIDYPKLKQNLWNHT